jgi:hypothetical protein
MSIQPGVGYTFTASSQGTNINIQQAWSPWSSIAYQDADHPFKVINIQYDSAGSAWLYQVVPGTLNNLVAYIEEDSVWVPLNRTTVGGVPDYPVSVMSPFDATTHKCYIYLRSGADPASPYGYPNNDDTADTYPRIINSDVELADTDTYGYVLLAVATEAAGPSISVVQYVTGSLWGDRIKLGSATATYYYARI